MVFRARRAPFLFLPWAMTLSRQAEPVQCRNHRPSPGPPFNLRRERAPCSPTPTHQITAAIQTDRSLKHAVVDHVSLTVIRPRGGAFLFSHQWPLGNSNLVIFLRKPGKDCSTNAGSYRPITVSAHVSKTLERIMEGRLLSLVEHWSILPTTQVGFREGKVLHSCTYYN